MKRSEMIEIIASELVQEFTNFMMFNKAQELAEIILSRIEKDGMLPPIEPGRTEADLDLGVPEWEPELPKMLVLVGLPGSGKSTYAKTMQGYEVVNQDLLGNREICIKRTRAYLKQGKSVIIDRTNINKKQRSYWLNIAKEFNIVPECVVFEIDTDYAKERIINRKNHPTIKENTPLEKIDAIIEMFRKSYEKPESNEGFSNIELIYIFKRPF